MLDTAGDRHLAGGAHAVVAGASLPSLSIARHLPPPCAETLLRMVLCLLEASVRHK